MAFEDWIRKGHPGRLCLSAAVTRLKPRAVVFGWLILFSIIEVRL